MLRNQKERTVYLENKENWEVVSEWNGLLRLLKLKGVNLYTIESFGLNTYIGNHWSNISNTSQYFAIYEANGSTGMVGYITKCEALDRIKETPEAPGVTVK
ncbi:MAG: hypothetical protein J6D36_01685 [Erysipelotrichaceae bacterium]|nr:hypothetical protein [Erysipelotrichaceae bacterium]